MHLHLVILVIISTIISTTMGGHAKAAAASLDFEQVWQSVRESSKDIQATQSDLEVSQISAKRAGRHWYPSIYLDTKSVLTDDPGTILFSKLGERNISGADFSPATMNFPAEARHESATLGARLTLFEGGSRDAQTSALRFASQAKQHQLRARELQEYSRTAGAYANLIILNEQEIQLSQLNELTKSTISRYQVGQKSNPLGYSGLLGLKNLHNRVVGELAMVRTQQEAILGSLHRSANLPEQWTPKTTDLKMFLQSAIDKKMQKQDGEASSASVLAQRSVSESLSAQAKAEYARFLPQIGVFAEKRFYNNSESTLANSQMVGAYLSWELFSASNLGAIDQAKLQARAAELQADAEWIKQRNRLSENSQAANALEEQVKLANSSLVLLEEQTQISRKLFNNGLINALQLTEIYGRRLDLLDARARMQTKLMELKTELLNYANVPLDLMEKN